MDKDTGRAKVVQVVQRLDMDLRVKTDCPIAKDVFRQVRAFFPAQQAML